MFPDHCNFLPSMIIQKGVDVSLKNVQIRTAMRVSDVKQWEVAEQLGISEVTVCRCLRTELPDDKKRQILQAISDVKAKRNE